jgi:hypothetical protein
MGSLWLDLSLQKIPACRQHHKGGQDWLWSATKYKGWREGRGLSSQERFHGGGADTGRREEIPTDRMLSNCEHKPGTLRGQERSATLELGMGRKIVKGRQDRTCLELRLWHIQYSGLIFLFYHTGFWVVNAVGINLWISAGSILHSGDSWKSLEAFLLVKTDGSRQVAASTL